MAIYQMYCHGVDLIDYDLPIEYYAAETIIFCLWAFWVAVRPHLKTPNAYNKDNILLAFYKGENSSMLMDVFSMFGLPVKSMYIVAGEHTLLMKSGDVNFMFAADGEKILRSKDYVILDTGKPWTEEFKIKMGKCVRKRSKLFGFRVRCIEGVSHLLEEIDDVWKPKRFYDNIPSIYLYKALNR